MSEKVESLLAEAKSQIQAGVRTIRDGISQIAPHGKAVEHLGSLEKWLAEPAATSSVIPEALRETLITTSKALSLLHAHGIESLEIDLLQRSHALQVMGVLRQDPFALKQELPESLPEGMEDLFPKPTPFLGYAACKDCGSPVVLIRVLQSVECSHCSAQCSTPTHWNELNAATPTSTKDLSA